MSYDDGWAGLNLEMPARIPHTEMSAEWYHIPLVAEVTGIDIDVNTLHPERAKAASAFVTAWDYDIKMNCYFEGDAYNDNWTNMGHADYAVDGADFEEGWGCPFTVEEALALDPFEKFKVASHAELLKGFNDSYQLEVDSFPNIVPGTGIYHTLMSGMIAVYGWDMLLTMAGTDPDGFGRAMTRYGDWIARYYQALAESDAELVWVHDDMVWTEGAFLHPSWYREYLFPNMKRLFAPLVEAGKKIVFVSDGDYTEFAKDVADCGVTGFWFECFTDLNYMCETFGKTHALIGNGDCRPLTFGTKADVRAEVERCMSVGRDCPGYFMCINGHMPPNIPVENALYYYEVYNELSQR
jgi:hypothetical protein